MRAKLRKTNNIIIDGLVGYLTLASTSIVLFDSSDLELIQQHYWLHAVTGYAVTSQRTHVKRTSMHRLIMGITDSSIWVDHINGNRLDNRRSNLRLVTPSQNATNASPPKNCTSSFKGVAKHGDKWRAVIYLGSFATEIEAAKAYNKWAKQIHGEYAWLNPIDEGDNDQA